MKLSLILALALVTPATAQNSSGQAATSGACSPAVTGNKNTFMIKCEVNRPQGEEILRILNRIISSQADPKIVMKKLDEILASTSRAPQIVNAPSGIGLINGNMYNPTVNNFGPPPAHLTVAESDDQAPEDSKFAKAGYQLRRVTITTDKTIPGAIIGVVFNGDVEISDGKGSLPEPKIEGASMSQLNWGGPLLAGGVPVPFSYGFSVNAPASFQQGMSLVITYRAKPGVYVVQTFPVGGG